MNIIYVLFNNEINQIGNGPLCGVKYTLLRCGFICSKFQTMDRKELLSPLKMFFHFDFLKHS